MKKANRTLSLVFNCLILVFLLPVYSQQEPQQEPEQEEETEIPEKKWEVNDPPGPRRTVPIDAREGTWMSIDVSPDGEEIIFDFLGDIYTTPFEGGEAKSLTAGIAWDMQPAFSPDGKNIAFTSDRGGGDNIWLMNRKGENLRQVTKESFRLLNSPAWTPDSQYVAARKHFTSRRSLGAGEIWLYHISGGSGLQMTKRPNDQKDVGEPAFSPDGRFLYFSQDTTPGDTFQYNKDPHGQIYTIRRLTRETGELENYISGAGGSMRPTPSPDGEKIAFVRRVDTKTVLFLYDVDSGAEWPIYDGLDRDMQETWAVHGVYPAMAWTPDSRFVVFWANGKIWRTDVAIRETTEIPFHVETTREIQAAVRFPVGLAPDEFDVKMLRWVQLSPRGDRVIYQALGHLYVRNYPEGEPRRLTSQEDHFEFYPSFSRDGSQVVYTTWNDDELATIRVVSSQGGEGRIVSSERGHYVEPVFSPDGSRIVYRKISGGGLFSPHWSNEPGIYWTTPEGDEPSLITENGVRPQFANGSDRVYVTRFGEGGKRSLVGLDLDGTDEMTYVESENATEFQLSPDGRWLAFSERFNVYLTPFVQTGRTITLGPEAKSIPVKRVSSDAGEYLHWSGDSQRLLWALGPTFYTRDLSETFAFVEGAGEELPGLTEEGVHIGFTADFDEPSGRIALVGARVITMNGDEVIENGTIVVNRNRIEAVGPAESIVLTADEEIERIDVSGKTIMPGLIDVHAHGPQGGNEIIPQQNWLHFSELAFGVTTLHDPSSDTSTIFAASELSKAGLITAPRIFSTGTILYGAAGSFKAEIDSLEDALFHLRRMKAVGAFTVKSYNQPRRDQRQQVIAAARELEMMVVPEGGSLFQHNLTMIADGHTGIEHSIPVADIYEDTYQLWAASETGYTPTLVVGYGGLWGENYWYQHTNVWENERLLKFVPRDSVVPRARRRMMAAEDDFNHFNNARIAAELTDRGVSVQLGAHGQREGLAAHWELWMFVQGGMTPLQAIRSATLNGAAYIGLDGDLGSIETGKLADLIVLERNPLQDIRNSQSVLYTMLNGRLYDAATMNQIGNHPAQRKLFYFERDPAPE